MDISYKFELDGGQRLYRGEAIWRHPSLGLRRVEALVLAQTLEDAAKKMGTFMRNEHPADPLEGLGIGATLLYVIT